VTQEEITRTVRILFEAIRSNPTISAVARVRGILEERGQQPTISKEKTPKRAGQWTDLLVILIVFVVIAGFIAIAQFVSPVVLSIIILGALLFFVVIITWLLRRSNELSEARQHADKN
jgi:hypothetical protein